MTALCACGHTRAVHLQQRRRCEVRGCRCFMLRIRSALPAVEPSARGLVTVDEHGVVVGFQKPQSTPAQRILRDSESRKLERRLWRALELAGLPLPDELEYQFALSIGRKWRSDGYYRAARLLVEVDGGSWVGGRHNHPSGFEEDCCKLSTAATLGYRVVRVTGAMIARGEAVALIRSALQPAEVLL
jgi:very-short-patch-repair endonuclease